MASTSQISGEGDAAADIMSVDGVVGVGGGVHVGHVVGGAGDGDVLVVERGAVGGGVDINLAALGGVDLVQAADGGNPGGVAQVGLKQGHGVIRGIEHGEAAVRLACGRAYAVVAFGHGDPQRVVVSLDHAAGRAGCAVTDRNRSGCRVVAEIDHG